MVYSTFSDTDVLIASLSLDSRFLWDRDLLMDLIAPRTTSNDTKCANKKLDQPR